MTERVGPQVAAAGLLGDSPVENARQSAKDQWGERAQASFRLMRSAIIAESKPMNPIVMGRRSQTSRESPGAKW